MDNYHVKIMNRALQDLNGIYAYIARTLLEPKTALALVETLEQAIFTLETLPGEENWSIWGQGLSTVAGKELYCHLPH